MQWETLWRNPTCVTCTATQHTVYTYLRAVLLLLHKLDRLLGAGHPRLERRGGRLNSLDDALRHYLNGRRGRCRGRRLRGHSAALVARAPRPLAMRVDLRRYVGGDRRDGGGGLCGRLRGGRGGFGRRRGRRVGGGHRLGDQRLVLLLLLDERRHQIGAHGGEVGVHLATRNDRRAEMHTTKDELKN